jgi:hypothetical protein
MERGLLVELSRNEESALRRISIGIYQSEMRPRDGTRPVKATLAGCQ